MKLMQKLECELLHLLSNKDCFDDIVSIQKILAIKKQFDESMSRLVSTNLSQYLSIQDTHKKRKLAWRIANTISEERS